MHMLGTDKSCYYEILNVPHDASKSQIREAYIRMRNTFSGQNQALYSLFDETEAQHMLERVEEAFRALNDDFTRHQYDGRHAAGDLTLPLQPAFAGHDSMRNRLLAKPAQSTKATQAGSDDIQERIAQILANGAPSDGTMYKLIRETVGVSEDEMQARTKIGVDHIRGIESNTFNRLPRPIFVKGFLRSYFKYLGIADCEHLVTAFCDKYQEFLGNNG